MDDLFLLGRLLFGGFFLYNGANHFLATAMFVQYTAAKAVPMPEIAVAVAGVLLLIGGFCSQDSSRTWDCQPSRCFWSA